jgi:hypothetical protein
LTPSLAKDYRNPHLSRIWYEAEQVLRNADRVICSRQIQWSSLGFNGWLDDCERRGVSPPGAVKQAIGALSEAGVDRIMAP